MAEKVRCVIICGSPDTDADFVKSFLKPDDYIICADSGYKTSVKSGVKPALFVGDFDSFDGEIESGIELIRLNTHKDDTDSMHCAEVALERGYKNIALLGATGARLDHTIANLSVLEYLRDNGAEAFIENEKEIVQILNEGEYTYSNLIGKTFSVFPFGCAETTVSYIGEVEYPAESLKLMSSRAVGISNIFKSSEVKVIIESGKALFIVNK